MMMAWAVVKMALLFCEWFEEEREDQVLGDWAKLYSQKKDSHQCLIKWEQWFIMLIILAFVDHTADSLQPDLIKMWKLEGKN